MSIDSVEVIQPLIVEFSSDVRLEEEQLVPASKAIVQIDLRFCQGFGPLIGSTCRGRPSR